MLVDDADVPAFVSRALARLIAALADGARHFTLAQLRANHAGDHISPPSAVVVATA